MRDEKEMLDVILGFAEAEDRVRAVILNGSRVNPNTEPDVFQDFDIVYFVNDVSSFIHGRKWIECFGEIMILQTPDLMQESVPDQFASFAFLMQFMDGNRIDLTLCEASKIHEFKHDSLTKPLLDKDGILPSFPESSDSDYRLNPPTAKEFADCCNEFWWVANYVAKGLWRNQLLYYKHMQDQIVRNQLTKMVSWHVGARTEFQCALGGYEKNLTKHLEPDHLTMLQATYSDADTENSWNALFAMCDLFRLSGKAVAEHMKFQYPDEEDQRVTAHLQHVRDLLEDAKSMY